MTDRELLEKASKAAGVFLTPKTMGEIFPGFEWDEGDAPVFTDQGAVGTVAWCGEDGKPAGTKRQEWNPLTDDGDALRLAAKLGISISFDHSTGLDVVYPTVTQVGAFAGWCPTYFESNQDDWASATRRAIVRAAAAIADA